MNNNIFILGGYGNFGKRIAASLSKSGYEVTIVGRNEQKAKILANQLNCSYLVFDAETELEEKLKTKSARIVINTCGPFQEKDYKIAKICIENKVNYIDLADGREFVTNISKLNAEAETQDILVISGASTVPALSSAVIEHYKNEFTEFDSLKFGISPGQKAARGLATTQAILGYAGKKLKPCAGFKKRYGWQSNYLINYPEIGYRLMANCEVPDLDLLPIRYGFKSIQFSAGMELWPIHFGIYFLGSLRRLGIPLRLERYAAPLLKISNLMNIFGSADGGMHMIIKGKDKLGNELNKKWFILGKSGNGPEIPTIPAIIIAKKIIDQKISLKGAMPCVALVTLAEYLKELEEFDISVFEK